MKWPDILALVRHGESEWNLLKKLMESDVRWREFLYLYDNKFKSPETKKLARILLEKYKPVGWKNDFDTPLSPLGVTQAVSVGKHLQTLMPLPDVVIVSPYLRCRQTYEKACTGWPELADVKYYIDERIREREVGMRAQYVHWRIYNVFHPEQKAYYESFGKIAYYQFRYEQGESVPDVNRRMHDWFDTLIREFSECNVVAFTHGVGIMSARTTQERLSAEEFVALDKSNPPKNCSVTIYKGNPKEGVDGRLILERYNETAKQLEAELDET